MSEETPFRKPVPFHAWGEEPGCSRRPTAEHPAPAEEETAPPASAEGMSEETPFRKPVPFHAWGEEPGCSRRPTAEHPAPAEEETAPPASAEGVGNLAVATEALSFVRSFLQNNQQDTAQKMQFLEQLRILCKATTVGSFRFFPSALLIRVVEVLIPWTASGNNLVRKTTAERLAGICSAVRLLCGYKDLAEFPVMGQLVGCLTLCHFDSSAVVAHWAAEGLCHLYAFAARCKGKSMAELWTLAWLLRRERDGEEEATEDPLENAEVIPMFFKGVLGPEQVSQLYLTALNGLLESNAHNTDAAACMERALREDPSASLGKVPDIVRFLHGHLDSLRDRLTFNEVISILYLLENQRLSEVVYTLLSCSQQCDSSAATLWGVLVSRSASYAEEVLRHLMACLQGQPQKPNLSGEEVTTLRLAAAHAFPALLEQPPLGLRTILQARWETACLNLVFGVSHLLESAEPACERQARSSAATLQRLFQQFRPEVISEDGTIWELLGSADSFHHGVSLLFRAMHSLDRDEQHGMVTYLTVILRGREEGPKTTALTILAELLRTSASEEALRLLVGQLKTPNAALRSLALAGMLVAAGNPQQVWKLLSLLPEAATSLRESDHPKAQRLFGQLHRCLVHVTDLAQAAEVAGDVLPLFDAESQVARAFGVEIFGAMLGRGATRALRDLALRSLVPLLLHLHDESHAVVEDCWYTLHRVAILLGHWKLQKYYRGRDAQSVCLVTVKRFWKVAKCSFLQQVLGHLRSRQVTIREAAVRILGLVGQETRDKRKLQVIYKALREMQSDEQPSVRSCAVQTTNAVEAVQEGVPLRRRLREQLRRVFRACWSFAEDV